MNPNQIQHVKKIEEDMKDLAHKIDYMNVWKQVQILLNTCEEIIEEKIKRQEFIMISNIQEIFIKRAKRMLDKAHMDYHNMMKAGEDAKENPKNK